MHDPFIDYRLDPKMFPAWTRLAHASVAVLIVVASLWVALAPIGDIDDAAEDLRTIAAARAFGD